MKIIIKDRKFGQENYECKVYIDGEKQDTSGGRNKEINCQKACEVKIEYINKVIKEKYIAIMGLFYWIISVVGGSNEQHPFGLPFDAVLKLKCNDDKDIVIETNAVWKEKPFQIKGNCSVIENFFISPKEYKTKWFLLEVLPISILMLFIFLIFFLGLQEIAEKLCVVKVLFFCVVIGVEIVWCMYVYNVIKK